MSDQTPRLALVEIASVRGQTCDATIVEAAGPAAVAANCRAVEVEHNYGDMTLKVELSPPPTGLDAPHQALAGRLGRSQLVRVARQGEMADARAYLIARRDAAAPDDPVPQLGPCAEPTWAIVGGGGQLLMPARPASSPRADAILVENLEKIARHRNLLAMRNPDPASALKDKVEFTLLHRPPGGEFAEVVPDAAGRSVFRSGSRLAFRIRNRTGVPVYASVLDFGLTFGVGLIYPVPGSNEKLARGNTIEYGVNDDEALVLFVPDAFTGDEGLETFKLIATTREVDFSWLRQGGVRSLAGPASPLESLLRQAGTQTRDMRPRVSSAEEWTTVEKSIQVTR